MERTMDPKAADAADCEAYEELYITPNCLVQTAESRFGAGVLDDLRTFVHATPTSYMEFDDEDDNSEDEDSAEPLVEEMELIELLEAEVTVGVGSESDQNHAQQGFPRIATTRNNLTALSQRYNLYFTAYQDKIHVYQPRRTGPLILPPPSLILQPRQSKMADKVDAVAMDYRFPHQINNIMVGNLGDLEIVLFAYDDGDVAAYYTHAIVSCIKTNSNQTPSSSPSSTRHGALPKLFFHENVHKSAWGLAIHEKSRLIAISTNLYEVTVFAFALDHANVPVRFPMVDNSTKIGRMELERRFPSRTRTWRIVLPLGRAGSNIPNIAFVDDAAGEADKVVAVDVVGGVWLLDVWRIGIPPVRWAGPSSTVRQMLPEVRGWGVLVLPHSAFRPTRTVRESLGIPGEEVIAVPKSDELNRVWLDTTCSLYYIKGLSSFPDRVFRQRAPRADYVSTHLLKPDCQEADLSDVWDTESDSGDDEDASIRKPPHAAKNKPVQIPANAGLPVKQRQTERRLPDTQDSTLSDTTDEAQFGRCIIPSLDETPKLDTTIADFVKFGKHPRRRDKVEHISIAATSLPAHLGKNFCLFRTTQTNIELQPFDRDAPCVECNYVLTRDDHRIGANVPWDLHPAYSERISMLHHVPELNLIVAGSPTGYVALITLTRTAKRLHLTRLRYGFRVECMLPRFEERGKNVPPRCSLVGVAVSPVPWKPGRELELRPGMGDRCGEKPPAAVFRLILHYKDHTILMYELARGRDREELLVY